MVTTGNGMRRQPARYVPRLEALEARTLPAFVAGATLAVGTSPHAIRAADFNGDGKLDLAVADDGNVFTGDVGGVSVLLGNGNGTFQMAVNYLADKFPYDLAVADFNGDGKPDLAVSNFASDVSDFSILLGNGNGTFAPPINTSIPAAVGYHLTNLATADFNHDGRPDLVVMCSSPTDNPIVLLGNGDGTFTDLHIPFSSGTTVAAGDWNKDGYPDLATPDGTSHTDVYLNNQMGNFADSTMYATANDPQMVAAADLNQDGNLDLVLPDSSSPGYTVLVGNGDGTFQTPVFHSLGSPAMSAAVADFNGDGKADLALLDTQDDLLGVAYGNGDGTFQAPADFALNATSSARVVVGDWNNDGAPDLAVSYPDSNTVALFLDQPPATHLLVSAPTTAKAGVRFSVTVTAESAFITVDPNYTGTVHFTSSDPQAVLPHSYTFVAADQGVHTFGTVKLKTAGSQTLTATDKAHAAITGLATVQVTPAAASHFTVGAPASVQAGSSFSITLTAFDPFGNVATGYRGTVHFTSSDTAAGVVLPADYRFRSTDQGRHTFSGVVLETVCSQTVTATDTAKATVQGSATVSVTAQAPGPAPDRTRRTSKAREPGHRPPRQRMRIREDCRPSSLRWTSPCGTKGRTPQSSRPWIPRSPRVARRCWMIRSL
jgi:hypothetical protein